MSNINEQALSYIETTGRALGVALKLAETTEANEKAAQEKIAGVRSRLVEAKLIDSDAVKLAERQLGNHAQTLDILSNVVSHYEGELKKASAKVASAVTGKASPGLDDNGHTKNANYVGRRRGFSDGPSESDRAIMRLIDKR